MTTRSKYEIFKPKIYLAQHRDVVEFLLDIESAIVSETWKQAMDAEY